VIHVHQAGLSDTRQMTELLNEIIAKGGTTAHTKAFEPDMLGAEMRLYPGQTAWILAENNVGDVLGFQNIMPHENLPDDAADIATFVKLGQTGLGIGSKLFEHTKSQARRLGYTWLNATIRADNESGLTYYQSRGFEDYKRISNTQLADGTIVDRICKRYEL